MMEMSRQPEGSALRGWINIPRCSAMALGLLLLLVAGCSKARTLNLVSITPQTATIVAGGTQQFTATGFFTDGSTQDLTASVTWSSSNTTAASISASGLATGIAAGTSTITATSGTAVATATLVVTAAPTLSSIAVTPATASIAVGATQAFVATGTFSDGSMKTLTTETWTSSNTATATIDATGLATGVAAGTATITATCTGITGTATLTVTPTLTSIAVTPANPSIAVGATQQFTATGTFSDGSTSTLTTETWTSSDTTIATIDTTGLATAIAAGSTTITATCGTITGTTLLTVTTSTGLNNLLNGQYAFLLSGKDLTGKYGVAGSFTADGSGNITAGEINFADSSDQGHDNLTGTYTIGTDGRGTLILTTGDTFFGSGGVSTFLVSMQSAQHGLLSQVQGTDNQFGQALGTVDLQDPATFNAAAITGGYAFVADGVDNIGLPLTIGGVFTADGVGTLSNGTEDLVDNFAPSNGALTGTFTAPDTNGLGSVTFVESNGVTSTFAYYIVDANTLRFVETDTTTGEFRVGSAFGQGGPPNFSNASLNGSYAFAGSGTAADSGGPLAAGGLLSADGNGNVTSGILDVDDNATLTTATPFTGTYAVTSDGRATVTLTGLTSFTQVAFYLTANNGVLFLDNDGGSQINGNLLLQTGAGAFTAASLSGNYAAAYRTVASGLTTEVIGQVTSDGVSAFTGTLDLEGFSARVAATPVTGTYVSDPSGRFTGSLATGTGFIPDLTASFYLVDSNTVLFISQDTSEIASGIMQLQTLGGAAGAVKHPLSGAPVQRTKPVK